MNLVSDMEEKDAQLQQMQVCEAKFICVSCDLLKSYRATRLYHPARLIGLMSEEF